MGTTSTDICAPCIDFCQNLLSYYDGSLPNWPGCEVRIDDSRPSINCRVCNFVRSACGVTSAAAAAKREQQVIEARVSRHGTVYLRRPLADWIYVLPLEASPMSVSGRLMQPQCDFNLVRRWIQCCYDWHGPDCYTPAWSDRLTPFSKITTRLIDVQRWCLILAPPECRYVALSYVWGTQNMLRTTLANLSELISEGGLRELRGTLPRTILDAIDVVARIGEKYLWVDSLCIVQDDTNEKHAQIANMDAVYGNAFLTIVAAAGMDSHHGLPGVSPDTRDIEQLILDCPNIRRVVVAQPVVTEVADASYWNTRAWTYQERFLSKRTLTFTENHIFFQCQRMIYCEDVAAEREDVIDYYQMEDYLPLSWSRSNEHMYKLHYTLTTRDSDEWDGYCKVIEEYHCRDLTFDSDILAAFAGMSKALAYDLDTIFLAGVPECLFHYALLWHPEGQLIRRRFDNAVDTYLPTWSWAAWKGKIVYEDILPLFAVTADDLVERTRPLVRWSKRMADGSRNMPIAFSVETGAEELRSVPDELSRDWHEVQRHSVDAFGEPMYDHETAISTDSELLATPSVEYAALNTQTWTSITGKVMSKRLRIELLKGNNMETTYRFSLFDQSGLWCGGVWLDESWALRTGEEHELIVISEGWAMRAADKPQNLWREEWTETLGDRGEVYYEFYNVLLVERDGDVAYRAGIGKIDKVRWTASAFEAVQIILA